MNLDCYEFLTDRKLRICEEGLGCANCDPQDSINFVHFLCWKLARRLEPDICIKGLVQLARLASPTFCWPPITPVGTESRRHHLPTRLASFPNLCCDTDLGGLLANIGKRMPFEIQRIIFSYFPAILQSMIRCLAHTSEYGSVLRSQQARPSQLVTCGSLKNVPTIRRLGITTLNVMGENCITKIGSDSRDWEEEIQVTTTTPIYGIQSCLGSYGLVALRILYVDGSKFPWLGLNGGASRRWFMLCKGDDLHSIQTSFDVGQPLHPFSCVPWHSWAYFR